LAEVALGFKHFCNRFGFGGNIMDIVDSIFLIPTLGFCFLLYMIIKEVWFD
jgi:hypothetical protein